MFEGGKAALYKGLFRAAMVLEMLEASSQGTANKNSDEEKHYITKTHDVSGECRNITDAYGERGLE